MKTKSHTVLDAFKHLGQMPCVLRRLRALAATSVSLLSFFPTAAFADELVNTFGLDFPLIYVQAGLEVDPVPDEYWFPVDSVDIGPMAPMWSNWIPNAAEPFPTSPTFTDTGDSVRFRGASYHNIAPHDDEVAPSPTWSYDISVANPAGFGAVETRVRRSILHPGGEHPDHYMAVVGVLQGTVPGPSVEPRRVIIGGSIGRHTYPYPAIPNKEPIYGGGKLEPRSGLPSPGDLDYPMGELLTIVDTEDTANPHFAMMAIVDGLQSHMIDNVFLRHGSPDGPILMDLRPMMQVQDAGDYGALLTIPAAVMPHHVAQMIGAGNSYVSMEFANWIHPDGAIVGAISLVQEQEQRKSGDMDGDGDVDAADYVLWRKASDWDVGLGDDNGDGLVNRIDYASWHRHFGDPAWPTEESPEPSHGAAIPEPSVAALIAIAFCLAAPALRIRSSDGPWR